MQVQVLDQNSFFLDAIDCDAIDCEAIKIGLTPTIRKDFLAKIC